MSAPWVIKLGGSLTHSPYLDLWLEGLADCGVIIVPGGGPFADQVRHVQQVRRFDEATAHAMALLAMAQYGLLLKGLCPRLQATDRLDHLLPLASTGQSVVWLPGLELLACPDIPQNWSVTADSLAAWLAGYLEIRNLLLVKSTGWPEPPLLSTLIRSGLIDPAFDRFTRGTTRSVWLATACKPVQSGHCLNEPAQTLTRLHLA